VNFSQVFVPGAENYEASPDSYWKLTRDVIALCCEMMREDHWTILLAPLLTLVPAGVGVNYICDLHFVKRWGGRVNRSPGTRNVAVRPMNKGRQNQTA
jgi:hypothetical protein